MTWAVVAVRMLKYLNDYRSEELEMINPWEPALILVNFSKNFHYAVGTRQCQGTAQRSLNSDHILGSGSQLQYSLWNFPNTQARPSS